MNLIEVIPEDASEGGQPRAPCEGLLGISNIKGKSNLVDLGGVVVMAYCKPIPFDFWIGTIYLPGVGCQVDGHHLQPTVWAQHVSPQALLVGGTLPHADLTKHLL